jgi:TPR repeat protein/tRNA A-37 threonylcarbamoyl transferase component Bud32
MASSEGMSERRSQILRMLSAGTISVAEAEQLLVATGSKPASDDSSSRFAAETRVPSAASDADTGLDGPTRFADASIVAWVPGQMVGPYQLERKVGAGGMGEVWKAKHCDIDRLVALKRIRADLHREPELLARIRDEARIIAGFEHPGIVTLYDFCADLAGPYLVMQWVEGQNFAQILEEQGPLPLDEVLTVVREAAEALQYAHERGVIHRDIKPANLLRTAEGRIKVADFGIARQDGSTRHTVTGAMIGTIDFIAPEVMDDSHKADARSDVWSLAATTYKLLTGRSVRGIRESLIPESIRAELMAALSDEPVERPATIDEFRKMSNRRPAIPARTLDEIMSDFEEIVRLEGFQDHRAESHLKSIAPSRLERWKQAAEINVVEATFLLARCYSKGAGLPQNYAEAVHWYRKSAELGCADGMVALGVVYSEGEGVAQDPGEAVQWYLKAADLGCARGMVALGTAYAEGAGVGKDSYEAARWYWKAAELGYVEGMLALGWAHSKGEGVALDPNEAVRWYRKAADLGCEQAMNSLGLIYSQGDGIAKDPHEAMRWHRKAADLGNALAMTLLAGHYDRGNGVAKDKVEAMRWYRKAADFGCPIGTSFLPMHAYWLGRDYEKGDEIVKDIVKAIEMYRISAEKGYGPAQVALKRLTDNRSWFQKLLD